MNKSIKFVLFLVILQILGNFLAVESRPKAKRGKGKAFGAGILTGGLAGAAIGHILTRPNAPTEVHHHHHIVNGNPAAPAISNPIPNPVPPPLPSTIIERGETLANGCYKQIVKEPDLHDVSRFIETEQLICPPSVPVPVPNHPAIPIVPVPVAVPAPVQPVAPADSNSSPQTSNTPVSDTPPNPNPQTPEQPLSGAPAAPVSPVVPQLPHPAAPVAPAAPASTGPSQVIVLSKKTGYYENDKKKNGSNSLPVTDCGFLLIIVAFMGLF